MDYFDLDRVNKSRVASNMKLTYGEIEKAEDEDPCWDSHKQEGWKKKDGKTVPNCVPKKVEKAEYTDEQLKELIAEHENLIKVIESSSKEDDKVELEKQKKELANYKSKLSKALQSLGIEL